MKLEHRKGLEAALVTRKDYPTLMENVHQREREGRGTLQQDIETMAKVTGRDVRTVWSWYDNGVPTFDQPRYTPTEVDVGAFILTGSYRRAYELLKDIGLEVDVTDHTYRRGLIRVLGRSGYSLVSKGPKRWRQLRLVANNRLRRRRNNCYEVDFVELALLVSLDPATAPVKVRLCLVVEQRSRLVAGMSLALTESSHAVIGALSDAIEARAERSPAHGIPEIFLVDGAPAFVGDAVTAFAATMGADVLVLPPRRPELKAFVERTNLTIGNEVVRGMPNELHPRLYDHHDERFFGADLSVVPVEWLWEKLLTWQYTYNYERPHSALRGKTPAKHWASARGPKPKMPTDAQRRVLRREQLPVPVTRNGVRIGPRSYWAAEMEGYVSQTLMAYHHLDDLDVIDLYDGLTHVCTCRADAVATESQLVALGRMRRIAEEKVKAFADARGRIQGLFFSDESMFKLLEPPKGAIAVEEPDRLSRQKPVIGGPRERDVAGLLARAGAVEDVPELPPAPENAQPEDGLLGTTEDVS